MLFENKEIDLYEEFDYYTSNLIFMPYENNYKKKEEYLELIPIWKDNTYQILKLYNNEIEFINNIELFNFLSAFSIEMLDFYCSFDQGIIYQIKNFYHDHKPHNFTYASNTNKINEQYTITLTDEEWEIINNYRSQDYLRPEIRNDYLQIAKSIYFSSSILIYNHLIDIWNLLTEAYSHNLITKNININLLNHKYEIVIYSFNNAEKIVDYINSLKLLYSFSNHNFKEE